MSDGMLDDDEEDSWNWRTVAEVMVGVLMGLALYDGIKAVWRMFHQ